MNRTAALCLAASLSLAATACDRAEPTTPVAPAAAPVAAEQDHGHDHGHDAHSGERHDLGSAKVGTFDAAVTQIGDAHAGEGATFEIRPTGGAGEITAVRAWVGVESGQGSVKLKAPKRGDFYDADLEVPSQLPDGSKFWVEFETAAGKSNGSFELAKD